MTNQQHQTDAMKKVIQARALLMKNRIGIASMLLGLELVEVDEAVCPTMATDGLRIYFSENWVLSTPIDELQGVLFHEGCHVIWEHPLRRGQRDKYWWNIACDIAINNWIRDELGMKLPEDGIFDPSHSNRIAEHIYRDIVGDEEKQEEIMNQVRNKVLGADPRESSSDGDEQSDQSGGSSDDSDGDSDGDSADDGSSVSSDSEDGDSIDADGGGASAESSDDGESNTGKNISASEENSPDEDFCDEGVAIDHSGAPDRDGRPVLSGEVWDAQDDDGKKLSQDEVKKVAEAIRSQASLSAKLEKAIAEGSLGKAIMGAMDANRKTEIDWVEVLRDFLVSSFPSDNTWSRLNKRHAWRGINLPSKIKSAEGGELAIAIDTSGSISQRELDQFASEIEMIAIDCGIEKIRVCYCDRQLHDTSGITNERQTVVRKSGEDEWWQIIEIAQGEEVKLVRLGGGGTAFDPPFNLYNEYTDDAHECVAFIYFTDGYGSVSAEVEPDVPVLWAIFDDRGMDYFDPDFGEKVLLTFNH